MYLRKMTMSDADKMLEWKNYTETRMYSIVSHMEIKKEDHYKWLPDNLQYFQVIENEYDFIPMGAIRIKDNEISIWIDRKLWNQGITSSVLRQVSKPGMSAKIVDGNIGSIRAFMNAGFKPISYHNSYYIFKK